MAAEGGIQSAALGDNASADGLPADDGAASGHAAAFPPHLSLLSAELRESASGFSFFQAVRALERLHPERVGVGRFVDPEHEVVRFSVNPSIAFPPAEIHELDMPEEGPARMSVNFFGLTGPLGVLPHHYTLLLAERIRARDHAPTAFLDIFHHRMISLFYRAWEKNRFTVNFEKRNDDRLSEHLLDLVGQGLEVERRRVAVREALPFYAGLLAPQARGSVALRQLLEDVFDVPVEIEQFIGGWYPLAPADQCALGDEESSSGQLGLGAVAGDEVWDQQTRVRLRLGPMRADRYNDFLPTGSAHAMLRWLVRYFSRDAFDFELQLVLAREDVPGYVLGDDEAASRPLGWNTWIRTEAFPRDADDTIVQL